MKLALIGLFAVIPYAASAGSPNTAEDLYLGCRLASDYMIGKTAGHEAEIGFCMGTVQSAFMYLGKIHRDYYMIMFPNITYPIKDQSTADRYISAMIMIGPNICFPQEVSTAILASVVANYAKKNPEKLSKDGFNFTVDALSNIYSCSPKNMP